MNYSWSVPIEKLMIWHANNWMKYESNCENLTLRLYYDQVLITSNTKVLESLNMNSKMKGIYKQDILLLFVSVSGKDVRKIKFQIKANVTQCLQKLGQYFPVTSYNVSKNCITPKFQNLNEILQRPLTQSNDMCTRVPLPSEYNNFIRFCILDPTFPQVVKETEKLIRKSNF